MNDEELKEMALHILSPNVLAFRYEADRFTAKSIREYLKTSAAPVPNLEEAAQKIADLISSARISVTWDGDKP